MCDNTLIDAALEILVKHKLDNKLDKQNRGYEEFCNRFASPLKNNGRVLINGFNVGIELQPFSWIRLGLDLINSRKATGTIQLFEGVAGADYGAYLPSPVFLIGTEIFLKGMWLYQHKECRKLKSDSYVTLDVRNKYLEEIKNISPKHNLLKIISKVEEIETYQRDESVKHFLKILTGIIKNYYAPFFANDSAWANERYPRRFYNDLKKISKKDALKVFPEHILISRLFTENAERIRKLWENQPV
jgi:hypothetical protein